MQPDVSMADDRVAKWRQRVWIVIQTARSRKEFWEASMQYLPANGEQLAIQGWQALRVGEHEYAQHCFRAALHLDPYAPSAWAGLSRATQERAERKAYMQAAFDLQFLLSQLEYSTR